MFYFYKACFGGFSFESYFANDEDSFFNWYEYVTPKTMNSTVMLLAG